MPDQIHEKLIVNSESLTDFDHDYWEGIQDSCSLYINGRVHGSFKGWVEARERVLDMVAQKNEDGFGHCSNTSTCEVECPKKISLANVGPLTRNTIRQRY